MSPARSGSHHGWGRGERVPLAGELVLDGVSKTFFPTGRPLPVLRGIDLTVCAGEFLSVVGTSGCGKSTLLRAVAGLEHADTGRITLDGEAVWVWAGCSLSPRRSWAQVGAWAFSWST